MVRSNDSTTYCISYITLLTHGERALRSKHVRLYGSMDLLASHGEPTIYYGT